MNASSVGVSVSRLPEDHTRAAASGRRLPPLISNLSLGKLVIFVRLFYDENHSFCLRRIRALIQSCSFFQFQQQTWQCGVTTMVCMRTVCKGTDPCSGST